MLSGLGSGLGCCVRGGVKSYRVKIYLAYFAATRYLAGLEQTAGLMECDKNDLYQVQHVGYREQVEYQRYSTVNMPLVVEAYQYFHHFQLRS